MSKITRNYLPELFALNVRRTKPSMVTVNLTNRCNQRCIYCEIGKNPFSTGIDTLTFADITWIIDQMSVNKIRKISFCGGEPFLFAGIIDLVSYAGKKNIRCSITTNGMTAHRLNENELSVLKECKAEINISIDSFREDIQSFTRGSSVALPNALKSILVLNKKQIPLTVLTAISKYNFHDLSQFFSTAWELGIEQVLFQPIIYYSNYPDQLPVDNKSQLNVGIDQLDQLMKELEKILLFEKKHKIKTNVYRIIPWIRSYLETAAAQNGKMFFEDVVKKFSCREIDAIVDISFEGGIQPCGLFPAEIDIYKNRHLGLMALWTAATSVLREDLLHNRYPECCNGCCHHFSRNMLASILKHPFTNRVVFKKMVPLIVSRILSGLRKYLGAARQQSGI